MAREPEPVTTAALLAHFGIADDVEALSDAICAELGPDVPECYEICGLYGRTDQLTAFWNLRAASDLRALVRLRYQTPTAPTRTPTTPAAATQTPMPAPTPPSAELAEALRFDASAIARALRTRLKFDTPTPPMLDLK